MGLRTKIISGFLVLVLMLLIAGIWSIRELKAVGSSVQRILDENYQSIHAAKTMIEALEREDSATLLLLLGKWDEGRSIIRSADSLFERNYTFAIENISIPGERVHLDTIRSRYDAYKNLWQRPIVGTVKEGNLDWYFRDVHKAFLAAKSAVDELISLNGKMMYQTASDLKNRSNRAVMPGVIAAVSAIAFALIFNYLVNYYVVSPVVRITDAIEKFRQSGTPFDVNIETRDEIYDLANHIRELCQFVSSKDEQS